MKTAVIASPLLDDLRSGAGLAAPEPVTEPSASRMAAYVALTKPRIAVMVLITVAVGFLLGAQGKIQGLTLFLSVVGTGAVAAGASVWNQVLERDRDARMKRTANRPIPSGRVSMAEAMIFGVVLLVAGLITLYYGPTCWPRRSPPPRFCSTSRSIRR